MAFESERKGTTFPVQELSYLFYGGKQEFERFQQVQQAFHEDPELHFHPNYFNMSRKDQFLKASRVLSSIVKIVSPSDVNNWRDLLTLPPTLVITGVHQGMVIPGFQKIATDEQCKKWLPQLLNFQAIGCYAQTELAHGSDVQNVQTTATYDPKTKEFVINTPSVSATKFWPGDLGIFANYALVYCQIIVNNKNHGVHPIWTPIRDANQDPLPGVQVGDIGPKLGYSSKDNGYLAFDHYRVPVDNLLQRYIKITQEGKVLMTGNIKLLYSSMMVMRKELCQSWTRFAGQALTIAVRYSIVRKQFRDEKGEEISVMDYQLQQDKLIPYLAEYWAIIFGGQKIRNLVESFFEASQNEDFSQMGLTHAILSGGKAHYTQFTNNCIEACRLSCGGHGFAHYSGLPLLYFDQHPNVTLEGENNIMNLQLASFLLKQLKNVTKNPDNINEYFEFLKHQPDMSIIEQDITQSQNLQLLLGWNCQILVMVAGQKLLSQTGMSMKETWDTKAGISLLRAAQSYIPYFNIKIFNDTIKNVQNQQLVKVLTQLSRVCGIHYLLTQFSQGLYLRNLLNGEHIKHLKETKQILFEQIRPNILALVEAQGFSDTTLKTMIGCEDGIVYERLFKYANEENTFNNKDSHIQRGLQWIKKMRDIQASL